MSALAHRHEERDEQDGRRGLELVPDDLVPPQPGWVAGATRSKGEPGQEDSRQGHWNVLAEHIVSYPPAHRRMFLELPDVAPQSYGEVWLEKERARLRARASAGLASDPRRHAPQRPESPLCSHPEPARPDLPARRRQREQAAATRSSPAVAALREPRGLRRLLPGVAALAVLVGAWFAASALSGIHQPVVERLPGSVPTAHGYLYVARPGDTLWSIASAVEPGADPRILVARLEQQLKGGQLIAGDRLILP